YDMWIDRGGDRFLGKVKMMWSINPNLSERVPMIFDYMYEHKSENDYFVGGDGGAGYIIPEALFTNKTLAYMGEKRPAANGNGGAVFAAYSKEFYDRFDMKITGFIINGGQPAVSKEMAECISQYSPLLNFTNCSWTPLVKYNNTYFVYCQNGLDQKSPDSPANLQTMYDFFDNRMGGYKFSAYRTICWTPTQIKKVVTAFETYAADKGRTVHYIDPYTYVKMLRAANNATVIS
ncbi:MAG: hypothetical protein IKM39_03845, partial [Clostridia bacterium]|nr:hypothetical protein [Clostridia bacterium]